MIAGTVTETCPCGACYAAVSVYAGAVDDTWAWMVGDYKRSNDPAISVGKSQTGYCPKCGTKLWFEIDSTPKVGQTYAQLIAKLEGA